MTTRRGKKIKDINHRSGYIVTIKMRKDFTFFAELPNGDIMQNSDGHQLELLILSWLSQNAELTWQPCIKVQKLAPFHTQDYTKFIGFNIERFYWAKKASGTGYLQQTWQEFANDRLNRMKEFRPSLDEIDFCPPVTCTTSLRPDIVYLPYTESTWVGLLELQNTIKALSAKLDIMLTTNEGIEKIALVGASMHNLLTDGSND